MTLVWFNGITDDFLKDKIKSGISLKKNTCTI